MFSAGSDFGKICYLQEIIVNCRKSVVICRLIIVNRRKSVVICRNPLFICRNLVKYCNIQESVVIYRKKDRN